MVSKLKEATITLTAAADGTASGVISPIFGRLIRVYVNYSADSAATTDISMVANEGTIFSRTDNKTDVIAYPKVLGTLYDGTGLTTTGNIYTEYIVHGHISCSMAQNTEAETAIITIHYEEF